jgi:hypothetical protein
VFVPKDIAAAGGQVVDAVAFKMDLTLVGDIERAEQMQ